MIGSLKIEGLLAASCRCAARRATPGQDGFNRQSSIVNPGFNHQ
jgi:hypothetical protein